MNKRFSTLLAVALMAGGLSSSLKATDVDPVGFTTGDFTYLKTGSMWLSIASDNKTLESTDTKVTLSDYDAKLWTVTKTRKASPAGEYFVYSFVNKATSQKLAVKLLTDNKGASTKAPELNANGNTEWLCDGAKGLYVTSGDSTFYFNDLKLAAVKGTIAAVPSTPTNPIILTALDPATDKVTLDYSMFNELLKVSSKSLYFNNGKDVSTGEKNILKEDKWKAIQSDEHDVTKFFLTNGKTAFKENPYMLMVDSLYNEDITPAYPKLVADTLAVKPGENNLDDLDARTKLVDKKLYTTRPVSSAQWTATLFLKNDSIVLSAKGHPELRAAVTTANYRYRLDKNGTTYADEQNFNAYTAVLTDLQTALTNAADAPFAKAALDKVIAAMAPVRGSNDYAAAFKTVKDATDYGTSTADKTAFEKLDPIIIHTPVQEKAKYFFEGFENEPMKAAAFGSNAGKVVLRKLSNTYVLTVAATAITSEAEAKTAGYIMPLVQPYASRTNGGTANIDVTKVYYIKDIMKGEEGKSETTGFFADYNPVSETEWLAEGQAFNPYCQFVVEKTVGTEKGNYTIYNRATGLEVLSGVANQLSGDSIVFANGDSLMLVDSKIKYTGKDAEKQIGHKFASVYDMTNKSFMIGSASPFMKNLFLHMQKDSTLKVAEGEVLYKLEPVVGTYEPYGATVAGIDTLIRRAYYVKSAKDEYLVGDENGNGNYILSKDVEKIGETVTLKGGTTVSVVNTAFFFVACNEDSSFVVVPAGVEVNITEAAKSETLTDACLDIKMDEDYKMLVNAQTGRIQMATYARAKNDFFFVTTEEDPASLFTKPKHANLKTINGDMVAVGKNNFAVAARVGDLKAGYEEADFTMYIDTARYVGNDGKDLVTPSYYITKGLGMPKAATASRLYMWVANDSVKANPATYLYDTNKTRVQFRTAERYGADSLIVANQAKNDTVSIADGKGAVKDSKIYGTINNFRFNILVDKDNAGSYVVRVNEGSQYLQSVNGMIVATPVKADAARITVNNAPAPVANEDIAAGTIKVVAGEGNVTVYGAAGKKVFVSDVLGKTTTVVATSDSQVIPAAQGVVFISVDGEAAVKAIVK